MINLVKTLVYLLISQKFQRFFLLVFIVIIFVQMFIIKIVMVVRHYYVPPLWLSLV